jgi:translation elongation factor P/translation initiation factor 5A
MKSVLRNTVSGFSGLLLQRHSSVKTTTTVVSLRFFSMDRAIKVVKLNTMIQLPDGPHKVMKITQGKRGKGGGFVRAKLKNLFTQTTFEKTFTSDENVESATFEKLRAQYNWTDGNEHVFNCNETFDEIRIHKDSVDTPLIEGTSYKLLKCSGRFIGIDAVSENEP